MSTHANDGGSAYPYGTRVERFDSYSGRYEERELVSDGHSPGMSLRDYFAASALQGLLAGYVVATGDPESEARNAYKLADAMLRAREASNG